MPEETTNQNEQTTDEATDQQVLDNQDEQTTDEVTDQQVQDNQDEPKDDLPKFEFVSEDTGTLKKKVTVTVPRKRIDAKLDEMFGELGNTAQVPGFRVGRAPRRLVEKRFGKEVSQDVRNALVGEALGEVMKEADFKTLGEPDLNLDDIKLPEQDQMEFSFEVEVAPEFELPQLEGIPVEKRVFEVTDEKITEYIDQLRQGRATFEDTEDAAAEGDVVTADTKVSGEGIENPVESKDQTLRVAPGQIEGLPLVDLGKELAGKKTGESLTMTVKVPQAHPNEQWQGKDATVEINITKVRKRIMPEIDEDFAKSTGFDSLDEMRKFVSERMTQRVEGDTQRAMREQVCTYLRDNTEFDLPAEMAARHAAQTLRRRSVDLLQNGVPKEKIEENLTELKAQADKQSAEDLKLQFVLAKIADNEGFEATEDEVNSRIAEMAAMYNRRPERMRHELEQEGNLGQVQSQLVEEKVLDKLLKQAKVTETTNDK